jgi:hypothetical protein
MFSWQRRLAYSEPFWFRTDLYREVVAFNTARTYFCRPGTYHARQPEEGRFLKEEEGVST